MSEIRVSTIEYDMVDLMELIDPQSGDVVYRDYYWVVTPYSTVLFYNGQPQCNRDKRVMDHMMNDRVQIHIPHGSQIRKIPFAFVSEKMRRK